MASMAINLQGLVLYNKYSERQKTEREYECIMNVS